MNSKLLFGTCMVFLALASLASAMTVEEFVASLDNSINIGVVNVTSTSDYIADTDSNGLNDTIVINLTLDINSSQNYTIQINLDDNGTIIREEINKSFSTGTQNADLNFSTRNIFSNQFNYSVVIYNSSLIVFRKDNYQTNTYSNYEQGISILNISDQNVNNDLIRISLGLNATVNSTDNVTVVLAYNNDTISSTEEKTLTIGSQTISIDFNNESIKSTHFNGVYVVDSVTIGSKAFDTNQTTASYNYETFAKTSYVKNFTDRQIDNNSNNLSEYLEINVSVEIKSNDDYSLEYELFDEFNNFVASIAKNASLTTGTRVVQTLINGSDIYRSKLNGPYLIKFITLSAGGSVKDVVFDAYTTNLSFFDDFERPPFPDLIISVNENYDSATNTSTINTTITNIGAVPAFNIFVDVFNDLSYSAQNTTDFLNVSETKSFIFINSGTNRTNYTAIVDFDNLVEEESEDNNIASTIVFEDSISSSLTTLDSTNGNFIFETIVTNNGDFDINNITWSFNPENGDSIISADTIISNLTKGDAYSLFIEKNYGNIVADPSITVTGKNSTGSNISKSSSLSIIFGDLIVHHLTTVYSNSLSRIFEFLVMNNLNSSTNVSWSFNTGESIINATEESLSPGKTTSVFIAHDYSGSGTYNVSANATSNSSDNKNITIIV